MTLELIIRPFQSRDVTPPTRIVGKAKDVEPQSINVGGEGAKVLTFRMFMVAEFTTEDNFTYIETSRKTHTKRVENPDDKEQFVDVEVIDILKTRKKTNDKIQHIIELKDKA